MRYILSIILFFLLFNSAGAAGPDGYISIPSISLYKSISFIPDSDLSSNSHYYDLANLNYGVAHLEHTMWNNTSGGRTVLVGHTPGGFSDLNLVQMYDKIIMLMNGKEYTFIVFDIYDTHKPDNSIFDVPPNEFELVLVTCIDKNRRLIVKAK